eukprot:1207190-Alexandrium_andersonii.AAC.1
MSASSGTGSSCGGGGRAPRALLLAMDLRPSPSTGVALAGGLARCARACPLDATARCLASSSSL